MKAMCYDLLRALVGYTVAILLVFGTSLGVVTIIWVIATGIDGNRPPQTCVDTGRNIVCGEVAHAPFN